MSSRAERPSGSPSSGGDATLPLLRAAQAGDADALNRLLNRYVPELQRWASGRLPGWARDLSDTQDLVQETVFRVFRKLEGFEYRGEGALRAYLRQSLMNRLRNEIRRVRAKPAAEEVDSEIEDRAPSPAEAAIKQEQREEYELALGKLTPDERELIIARVELGMTYQEIADALRRPSPDAARMAVVRALIRLTDEMTGKD